MVDLSAQLRCCGSTGRLRVEGEERIGAESGEESLRKQLDGEGGGLLDQPGVPGAVLRVDELVSVLGHPEWGADTEREPCAGPADADRVIEDACRAQLKTS